eukprot:3569687-Amphidinium_carterae.1
MDPRAIREVFHDGDIAVVFDEGNKAPIAIHRRSRHGSVVWKGKALLIKAESRLLYGNKSVVTAGKRGVQKGELPWRSERARVREGGSGVLGSPTVERDNFKGPCGVAP